MTGTGFLDNWKPVDTNKEPSQQEKKVEATNLPSTAEVAQTPVVNQSLPSVEERQSGMVSGFAEDFPIEALVDEAPPLELEQDAIVASAPSGAWSLPQSANPAAKRVAVARSTHVRKVKKVICGVSGGRKGGKSGMLLDSRTDEEIADGAMIFVSDFDGGADSTVSAHHQDKPGIVVLNPWVLNRQSRSRVPFNYPETFNKAMDDLLYALEVAEAQEEYFKLHGKMPNPYLKTFIFDGMDHWLHVCGTAMKIEDLDLGDDAVDVSGKKTTTRIGRFNWEFRKNRYQAAMNAFQELARLNVHVYVITGVKPSYDSNGNEIMGADVPAWMKDTERDLEQLIEITLEEERDEIGALTGKVVSKAQLKFDRTSLRLPEPVILFEQQVGTDGQWFGYKGLRDGSFEHPDDIHELVVEEEEDSA